MISRGIGSSVRRALSTSLGNGGSGGSDGYTFNDADAAAYVSAVETADGQSLEDAIKEAIDTFVAGCKTDSIWTAIKASCILAGARTLAGCLVPLVGPAPTNTNFVSGDYNRITGLVGNGTNKFLDTNYANNSDPQNSSHLAAWVASFGTGIVIIGTANEPGANTMSGAATRNRAQTPDLTAVSTVGFYGMSRSASTGYTVRNNGSNRTVTQASSTPSSSEIGVFGGTGNTNNSSARLRFYSAGEHLDLALLDARLTTLTSAIATALA